MKKKLISTLFALFLATSFAFGGCFFDWNDDNSGDGSDGSSSSAPIEEDDGVTVMVTPLNVYTYDDEGMNIKSSLDIATRVYLYDANKQRIKDFTISSELLSGGEYVSLENNVLKAKGIGTAKVKVDVTHDGKTYSAEKDVNVKVAYTQGDLNTFVAATASVEYGKYMGTIDGVENPYAFTTKDLDGLEAWNCRIRSTYINGDNMSECYKNEYRYITFDFYFGGEQGKTQLMPCMGSFRVGWLDETHMPSGSWIKIIEDGKITNVLKHNTWQTVVVDLAQYYACSHDATFQLCTNHNSRGTSTYLSNMRYWHTTDYLDCFEKAYVETETTETIKPPLWDDANVDVEKAFVTPSGSSMQISAKEEIAGKQAWKLSVQRPTDISYEVWSNRIDSDLVSLINAYEYDYLDITVYVPSEDNAFKGMFVNDGKSGLGQWLYMSGLNWKVSGAKCYIFDENGDPADNLGCGEWRTIRFDLGQVTMSGYLSLAFDLKGTGDTACLYIAEMKVSKKADPHGKVLDGNVGDDVAKDKWTNV